jgi:TPR repeat protein
MDYRPNDFTRAALSAYLAQDLWEAMEYYEEAADLGVQAAQENAAFI